MYVLFSCVIANRSKQLTYALNDTLCLGKWDRVNKLSDLSYLSHSQYTATVNISTKACLQLPSQQSYIFFNVILHKIDETYIHKDLQLGCL